VAALQKASLVTAAQRRVCEGTEISAGDPDIRVGLGTFTASWGLAVTGLAREMMMDQAIVLLEASGLKHSAARFNVPTAFDDDKAQSGD